MAENELRVLVADDEPLARQRIEDLLAKQPGLRVVATAEDGNEAVDVIRREKPDLLFLDVQMPGKNGFDVVNEIGAAAMPATIFVTAFDRFAVNAFDVAAIDYLVKPFDDERFAEALRRARRAIELKEVEAMTARLIDLVQTRETAKPPETYLDRIPVESRGQIRVVPVSRIDYITASGPYAELHVGDRTFAVRERMQTLEEQLDPGVFFRIHRSAIVRLDRIDVLLHHGGGDYAVRLKDGTQLDVSRGRREELERKMGVTRS